MSSGASLNTKDWWDRIRRAQKALGDSVAVALYQEVQVEATEVKKRTPVDKGNLRNSIQVVGPIREGTKITVWITAGAGPSADYAAAVHEDLEAVHKVGQAKYLESVLHEAKAYIAERVAKRVKLV